VKVVVQPVKVGGHYRDIVCPVLDVEAFTHLQPGNFSYGIGFICIFEGRREEVILFHRLWRLLGIDAGATQEQQFLHVVPEAFVDNVVLDLEVLVDKVGPVGIVGNDPAHVGGSKKYVFGFFFFEKRFYGSTIQQIQFPMGTADEVCIAFFLQVLPDGGTDQPVVAGNVYFAPFIHYLFRL
jgi:hypothetical protein